MSFGLPPSRVELSLDTVTSRHASLRTWRAQCRLGKSVTELILATTNTTELGAAVSGSLWAVRDSSPIPLLTALLPPQRHHGLKLQVEAADTMPFAGELAGRFLSLRNDVNVPTGLFSVTPPGDWWVALCAAGRGTFLLGVNDLACSALLAPSDEGSAKGLAGSLLGLWIGGTTTPHDVGAA